MAETISALLVEDDMRLAKFTADYLSGHGVLVTHSGDGQSGFQEASRHAYDVIVLDLMLPGRDGMSLCRSIRDQSDVPIVMLTARVEEADRITALESGSDDYIVKPFSPRELLARIRAVVRRSRGEHGPSARELRCGLLTLQFPSRQATVAGSPLTLTTAEFDLLAVLAKRAGRVLSREQLLELVRGNSEEVFDRAIDVQVSRLRQKLAAFPGGENLIRTVRGVGYLLTGPNEP